MNERGARSTKKEFLRDTITRALMSTDNRKMFIEFLTAEGILPYTYRDRFNGVILDEQKKVCFSILFSSNPEMIAAIKNILETMPEQEKDDRSMSFDTLEASGNTAPWPDKQAVEPETENMIEDEMSDQDKIVEFDAPSESSSDTINVKHETNAVPPAPQGNPGVMQGSADSRRIIPEQDDDLDIRR